MDISFIRFYPIAPLDRRKFIQVQAYKRNKLNGGCDHIYHAHSARKSIHKLDKLPTGGQGTCRCTLAVAAHSINHRVVAALGTCPFPRTLSWILHSSCLHLHRILQRLRSISRPRPESAIMLTASLNCPRSMRQKLTIFSDGERYPDALPG